MWISQIALVFSQCSIVAGLKSSNKAENANSIKVIANRAENANSIKIIANRAENANSIKIIANRAENAQNISS